MSVFAPDTLDAGHWSFGFRLAYTRPERRSDAELAALTAQDIDAHNTDYNFNGSAGLSYGIDHHLTISAELPYVRRDHLREGRRTAASSRSATSRASATSIFLRNTA